MYSEGENSANPSYIFILNTLALDALDALSLLNLIFILILTDLIKIPMTLFFIFIHIVFVLNSPTSYQQ